MKKQILKNFLILMLSISLLSGCANFQTAPSVKIEESYISNLTWESGLGDSIPYIKGDKLEYLYIIYPEDNSGTIDISEIKKIIDIETIEINGEEVEAEDILDFGADSDILIDIVGIALDNGLEKDINDKVKVELNETNNSNNEISDVYNDEENIEEIDSIPNQAIDDIGISGGTNDEISNIEYVAPSDISIDNTSINSNISNLVEIKGDNLENIVEVLIGGDSYPIITNSQNQYLFDIPKEKYKSGVKRVSVRTTNGSIINTGIDLSFTYSDSPITIITIMPDSISLDGNRTVILHGKGFDRVVSLQLNNNIVIEESNFHVYDSSLMSVTFPSDIEPSEYYFNIMDTSGIYEIKETKFNIIK